MDLRFEKPNDRSDLTDSYSGGIFIAIFIIFNILNGMRFLPGLQNYGNIITLFPQFILSAFSVFFLAFKKKYFLEIITIFTIFLIIIIEMNNFSFNTDKILNLNSMAQFTDIGSLLLFSSSNINIDKKVEVIAKISIAYCIAYAIMNPYFLYLAQSTKIGLLPASDGRADRVFMVNSYAACAVSFCIGKLYFSKNQKFTYFIMLIISAYAIFIAISRTFTFALIVSIFISLISRKIKFRYLAYFKYGIFLIGSIIGLYFFAGLYLNYNPYSIIAQSETGRARFVEYTIAQEISERNPFLGMGIASSDEARTKFYTKKDPSPSNPWAQYTLYADDIGPAGYWVEFGIFGFLFYFIFLLIFINQKSVSLKSGETAMFMAVCASTAMTTSIMSPVFVGRNSVIIFSLFLSEIIAFHREQKVRLKNKIAINNSILM